MSTILGYDYSPITNGASIAYSHACTAGNHAIDCGKAAYTFSSPYAASLAEKTEKVWGQSQPYLAALWATFCEFMRSPLGCAVTLIVSTIVLMKLSQLTEDKLASVLFMTLGIVAAVASGAFLLQAGVIPQSIMLTN